MIKKYISMFILLLFIISCVQNKAVTIKVMAERKIEDDLTHYYKIDLPINTTELVYRAGAFTDVKKIEGIERLRNLKKLNIQLGDFFYDYSFLQNMQKLEILIITYCRINNLDFLQKMKYLKVLILDNSKIFTNEIDFINNKQLEYLNIWSIKYSEKNNHAKPFVPNIKNIPDSLKYIIYRGPYLKLTRELLNKFINVPYIILGSIDFDRYERDMTRDKDFGEVYKSYVDNRTFIMEHENFLLKEPDDVLPEEYKAKVLYINNKWLEENIWDKMEEVPPFTD